MFTQFQPLSDTSYAVLRNHQLIAEVSHTAGKCEVHTVTGYSLQVEEVDAMAAFMHGLLMPDLRPHYLPARR